MTSISAPAPSATPFLAGQGRFVVVGVVAVVAVLTLALAATGGLPTPEPEATWAPEPEATWAPEPEATWAPAVVDVDDQIVAGAEVIARACSDFAGAYGYGPSQDDVDPYGAVAQFVASWPTNPVTGAPMVQGTGPGDFQFGTAIRMPDDSYRGYVNAYLASGESYPVEFSY